MKRRIFLAIDLDPKLKSEVAALIRQWQWLPIRWVKPDNWHITLIPPAYFTDEEIQTLISFLERHRWGKAFEVPFSRVALAPPGKAARMIWLEGNTPPEFARLKTRIEEAWRERRDLPLIKREDRPPKLHVTLARFEPGELRELGERMRVLAEVNFGFETAGLVVMESRLLPGGAEYESLATVSLAT